MLSITRVGALTAAVVLVAPMQIEAGSASGQTVSAAGERLPPAGKNRLAFESSPYLLQHADNPVDWYPWGEEAFAKARRENKPIFLSVGYSTCHWCHVMEHESFESPKIAEVLNAHFVAIKVDREERPDIDRLYMQVTLALTGAGGWPMNVLLTPELKPFYAGTYFPPEGRYGRPGLRELLLAVQRSWSEDQARLLESASSITSQLAQHAAASGQKQLPDARVLAGARAEFAAQYDAAHGGFGGAPKFPRPVTLGFLLREQRRSAEAGTTSMVLGTLQAMAAGGIRDHLGGGFHRYSTDRLWLLPHFEKMLYDQAQLAIAYLEGFQVTQEPALALVARETLDYVLRDMTDAGGGFYSAEDADAPLPEDPKQHAEGAFYVWTASEITQRLGADAELFAYVYGVSATGNVAQDPHDEFRNKNVLHQVRDEAAAAAHFKQAPARIKDRLARARQTLLAQRAQRPRPHRDDKILTAWNGLTISALARAAQLLDDARYAAAARRAAQFVLSQLYDAKSGELRRRYRQGEAGIAGQLDDYAFLIQALLDLYETDFDVRWLEQASRLQEQQIALFWDEQRGGFYDSPRGDASILWRTKDSHDSAEPTGNSIAALNLLRLAQILHRDDWHAKARTTISAFADQLADLPTAMPQLLAALEFALAQPRQIVIAGDPRSEDTQAMLREVRSRFLPNKILLLADGAAGQQWLAQRLEFLKNLHPLKGKATAYVCRNYACDLPTSEVSVLARQLAE